MFKVIELKNGGVCLETTAPVDALTEANGMQTHFIYASQEQLEKLAFELWALCIDRGLKVMTRDTV